ncbi:glycosyltransferase family 2 protein [Vibrio alginolyticus]
MKPRKIVIALCTNKRPQLLSQSINSLSNLDYPKNTIVDFILIDNDIAMSGQAIFNSLSPLLPFNASYFSEKEKGITFARNRALLEASRKDADYVAFFDDDAIVEPKWLSKLVEQISADGNSIITGPQLSIFDESSPSWCREIVYFNPKRYPTGYELRWAATNNILIPMKIYTYYGVQFDNSLRYSGGSDQCFCMEAKTHGFRVIWADEAIVREKVPLERTSVDWVIKRNFRYGSTGFFMHRKEHGYFYALTLSVMKSIYYALLGICKVLISMPNNKLAKVEGGCFLVRSLGWISGVFNKKHNEYENR